MQSQDPDANPGAPTEENEPKRADHYFQSEAAAERKEEPRKEEPKREEPKREEHK